MVYPLNGGVHQSTSFAFIEWFRRGQVEFDKCGWFLGFVLGQTSVKLDISDESIEVSLTRRSSSSTSISNGFKISSSSSLTSDTPSD